MRPNVEEEEDEGGAVMRFPLLKSDLGRLHSVLKSQISYLSSLLLPIWIRRHGGRWGHESLRMDMTWIIERMALGGGIWTEDKMSEVARAGVTHIIDMQIEFDDTQLADPHGIRVLWNPVDDDFRPKPPEVFQRGVDFALEALDDPGAKLFIHCAAGVHRAPMMTLAVMRAMGWELNHAQQLLQARRPVVDLADVYVQSVENFISGYETAANP